MKSVSVSTSTSTTDVQKPIEVTGLVQEYIMESIQNDFSDSSPEAWIAQTVTMYYNVDFNYILLMNKFSCLVIARYWKLSYYSHHHHRLMNMMVTKGFYQYCTWFL
jgi:hypothetical protein